MQHAPVILLISKQQTRQRAAVDKWLTDSRYTTCEAADAFQALEQLADFTTGERPDVIFLHVDSGDADMRVMQTIVATPAGEADIPIIDFASEITLSPNDKDFEKAIADLVCRLDQFIPKHGVARV